jgi:endonuclease/exonuclease/phosphatase (EEP) superfamily protein YafD
LASIGAWPHVASQMTTRLEAVEAGEREIRVASFNTLYVNDQVDAVIAEISRLDADVITLLEMGPNKRRILDAMKLHYPYQADCYDIDFCNLVILSKLPIAESDAKALWEGPPYIRAKLGPEAGGLTILGVHTIRFPQSRAQYRQVVKLGAMVEAIPGRKLVLGDFNATPFSRIIETVETHANLKRLTVLPSWPSYVGLPQIAIDHIFVSSGIKLIEDQKIGEPAGSDHYPVTLRIAVPVAQ